MIRRPPRSTLSSSSAASDVYKRQIKDIPISTETIHVNIPEHEDFEIINSFANKMLTEATPIDEEIQNVINDHFWDML